MFAPVLCQCVLWMFVIWASKILGELFGIRDVCVLLESVGEVVSVIFAMLLCVMSVFIISTASVLVLGGAG
jgi:stage III sporulation protein AE